MGTNERRERERQEIRERILEAARELFVAQGYEAVTMRQIAKKIEYTPTAIYFHFQDKEHLISELCAIDFLAMAQTFNHLTEVKDPLERLMMMAYAYLEFGLDNPNHYRLLFMTPHPHVPPEEVAMIRRGNPAEDAYAFLRATVIECIAAGYLRPEYRDPELVAQILWSGIHGTTSLHITRAQDPWIPWRGAEAIVKGLLDSFVQGLMNLEAVRLGPAEIAQTSPQHPDGKSNKKAGK